MFRFGLSIIGAVTFAASTFLGSNVLAAEPADGKDDLGRFLCKDVMRLSGDEREIAMALAHGYVLGRKGTTEYDVEVLANITDQFIDHCLDHPNQNALQSFEKLAK